MLHLFLLSILTYTLSCASPIDEINERQSQAHLTYSKRNSGSTLKIQPLKGTSQPGIEIVDSPNISSSDNDPGRSIVVFKTTGEEHTPIARAQIQFGQAKDEEGEDSSYCRVAFERMIKKSTICSQMFTIDSDTLACIEPFFLKKTSGEQQRDPDVEPTYDGKGDDEFVCARITYYLPEAQNGDRYSVCLFMDLSRPLGFYLKGQKCAQNAEKPDNLCDFRYNKSTSTLEKW